MAIELDDRACAKTSKTSLNRNGGARSTLGLGGPYDSSR